MTPFPKDDDFDYNPEIDRMIEDRLFDNRYAFREYMADDDLFNFEMRPYIYPDVDIE